MVDEETCAACSFYQQDNDCQRTLEWVHRVELTQATKQGVTQWGRLSPAWEAQHAVAEQKCAPWLCSVLMLRAQLRSK
jgi:hypothetical protein